MGRKITKMDVDALYLISPVLMQETINNNKLVTVIIDNNYLLAASLVKWFDLFINFPNEMPKYLSTMNQWNRQIVA